MISPIHKIPTTNAPLIVQDLSINALTQKRKVIQVSSDLFYGTIAQAEEFCQATPQFKTPSAVDLISIIYCASVMRNEAEGFAKIYDHASRSGHFLSGHHTFENQKDERLTFHLSPQPFFNGTSYKTIEEFGNVAGFEFTRESNPIKMLDKYVLNHQTQLLLFFGIPQILDKPIALRMPHNEYRVNPHGIVSLQGSLNELYFSTITDANATGIVPLVIAKK